MKDVKMYCTACNRPYSIEGTHCRCEVCNEPLELEEVTRGEIRVGNPLSQSVLTRYGDFFPFDETDDELSLGEGFTPLVRMEGLSERVGVKHVYLKNESQNPTWSFKDRGTLLGVQHAIKLGYKRIGTVSTGNMAPSVAAYGKKAGLETFIFVSKGIAPEKLNPIAIYDPHLIKVDGDYGNLYFKSLEIGYENEIYFINSDVPFRVEGSKTIAFEICEQLNFKMPDYIVVPTSAGGNIRGIEKGFREFKNCGLIKNIPKIICAQASGCSPIYNAYAKGDSGIERVVQPETIAHAIENPYPPSGNRVLSMIEENGGLVVAVTDEAIVSAQKLMAEEGVFCQPASAVPLASLLKLKESDFFKGDESVVCVVTGSGLKYTAAFDQHDLNAELCKLDDLNSYIRNLVQGIE